MADIVIKVSNESPEEGTGTLIYQVLFQALARTLRKYRGDISENEDYNL